MEVKDELMKNLKPFKKNKMIVRNESITRKQTKRREFLSSSGSSGRDEGAPNVSGKINLNETLYSHASSKSLQTI